MTTIRVLKQWDIPISDVESDPDDLWWKDWALRSPASMGRHLSASWEAFSLLADNVSARTLLETFGGVGSHAVMLENLFTPEDHTVLEYSHHAVEHLSSVLPDHVEVLQADSYSVADRPLAAADGQPWDLVVMDFGDLTARWTVEGEKKRVMLDEIFAQQPKAATVTDVAGPYHHLHRKTYEGVLGDGAGDSYHAYLEAFSARFESLWGYKVLGGGWHTGSSVLGLVPVDHPAECQPLRKVTEIGLEVLP